MYLNDKPHCVMLIGLPCSGKTTYGNTHYFDHIRVSWDDSMLSLWPTDSYGESFKLAKDKEVRKLMNQTLEKAIKEESDIIMDLTFMSRKMRRKYLSKVPETYFKTGVVCIVHMEEIQRRNRERAKMGKYIPPNVFADMAMRYQEPTESEFDELIYNINGGENV